MSVDVSTHLNRCHFDGEDKSPLSASVQVSEHEHSHGPYAVLNLQIGDLGITIWPGASTTELADLFGRVSASLHSAQARINSGKNALETVTIEATEDATGPPHLV